MPAKRSKSLPDKKKLSGEADTEIVPLSGVTGRRLVDDYPIEKLEPDPSNVKVHTERSIEKLASTIVSVEAFVEPILIAEGWPYIIAGHRRYMAAKRLGYETVPVLILEGEVDAAQARAIGIAHNRLAEDSDWDKDLLTEVMVELDGHGYGIRALGFEEGDVVEVFGLEGGVRSDHGLNELEDWDNDDRGEADPDGSGSDPGAADTEDAVPTAIQPKDIWTTGNVVVEVAPEATAEELDATHRALRTLQRQLGIMPLLDGVRGLKDVARERTT